jgi:hypothetical protein
MPMSQIGSPTGGPTRMAGRMITIDAPAGGLVVFLA